MHLETKGAKTVVRLKSHLKPLRNWFALARAVNVTTAEVEKYVAERLKLKKARATINRETGALKQARLSRVPYIPMMREENARQGFFEHADFENFVACLPEPINDIARFGYGRRNEEFASPLGTNASRQRAIGAVGLPDALMSAGRVISAARSSGAYLAG